MAIMLPVAGLNIQIKDTRIIIPTIINRALNPVSRAFPAVAPVRNFIVSTSFTKTAAIGAVITIMRKAKARHAVRKEEYMKKSKSKNKAVKIDASVDSVIDIFNKAF